MRYPDEPHMLVGGVLIHLGAVSIVRTLVASGHSVALTPEGVVVEPVDDLPEDTAFLLEALEEDLVLLLAAGGETIH
jgi:hypothetical protein